jgi:EAL domain-containing protein (putative c-di-GMP-specific phosphodiesterase class I)
MPNQLKGRADMAANQLVRRRGDLVPRDLDQALAAGDLFLLYQPTFRLGDMTVSGAEALIRWRHPGRGVVSPGEFIPLAEDSGLIDPIGRWGLETACLAAAGWQESHAGLGVAVNVSGRQLERDQIVNDVGAALERSTLPAALLTLEITETALARDLEAGAARLGALRALGVRVSIDDFGTGYSSISYLSHFPLDILKIDRSFIAAMNHSSRAAVIVRAMIQLGRALGMTTVAEGIEEGGQLAGLQAEQCEEGQGFYLGGPMSAPAFQRLVAGQGEALALAVG